MICSPINTNRFIAFYLAAFGYASSILPNSERDYLANLKLRLSVTNEASSKKITKVYLNLFSFTFLDKPNKLTNNKLTTNKFQIFI